METITSADFQRKIGHYQDRPHGGIDGQRAGSRGPTEENGGKILCVRTEYAYDILNTASFLRNLQKFSVKRINPKG